MKYLIDIDGTLLVNNTANLDAVDFIKELQERSIEFLLMTNSVAAPEKINERLKCAGMDIPITAIINPIVSINSYISNNNINSAYIVGSEQEATQVSVVHDETQPEIVLLLDFERANVDYQQLQKIYQFIENKIPILSASGSLFYLHGQNTRIDTGAFLTMFEALTKTKIPVFGKPSLNYFNEALRLLNCTAQQTTVIGDDWRTDMLGAQQAGCKTILVKSGKYEINDEKKCKPTLIVNCLQEIFGHEKLNL